MSKSTRLFIWPVAIALGLWGAYIWPYRPTRSNHQAILFPGITYTRQVKTTPRLLLIHSIKIEADQANIAYLVTPGETGQAREYRAQTTSDFARTFQVHIAINGGFFSPFYSHAPWDYYPHSGDLVDIQGLSISDQTTYSPANSNLTNVCITGEMTIIQADDCAAHTEQALAGWPLLLQDGQVQVTNFGQDKLHPRTAIGVDRTGQTVWLVVVDGRQRGYSEGVTLLELAYLLLELGAVNGVNLDGGGSSTLVVNRDGEVEVLNAPYNTRLRMRERPVANHLGVYVRE